MRAGAAAAAGAGEGAEQWRRIVERWHVAKRASREAFERHYYSAEPPTLPNQLGSGMFGTVRRRSPSRLLRCSTPLVLRRLFGGRRLNDGRHACSSPCMRSPR